MTLNLLRRSRTNQKLSDYAAIFGIHDFNRCPIAPPGTKVIVHEKTDNHQSWSLHGAYGWYIGPLMKHNRCVKCYMLATSSVRNVYTLTFFSTVIPFPKMET